MIAQLRASPLFGLRRLLVAFVGAFVLCLFDMFFINLFGIATVLDLLEETLIHGLGFYLALTIMAVFGTEIRF